MQIVIVIFMAIVLIFQIYWKKCLAFSFVPLLAHLFIQHIVDLGETEVNNSYHFFSFTLSKKLFKYFT